MRSQPPWRGEHLGAVLASIDAGWSPECVEQPPSTGQWGVLKVSAVTSGTFKREEAKTLPAALSPRAEISVKRGDVVMARANGVAALVGVTAQVREAVERLMLSDKLLRLNPNPQLLTQDYLASLMRSSGVRGQLDRVLSGSSGQRNISQQQVRALRIPIPPLSEQRRIAEILNALDEVTRKSEQLIAKLKQVKQGLLPDLLTRGIDDNGELRDPIQHPGQFKDEPELGRIPKAWGVRRFGDLCESSAFGPRFPSDRYAPDGSLATLRTTDMSDDGDIDLATMPRAAINPMDFGQHLLRQGDLVISRSGTCGIAGVFPGHFLPVVPGAFLIRFRMKDQITAHLYRRYFNSTRGRPRLERLAVGGVQKNIKGSDILSLRVPCLEAEETKKLVTVMGTIEEKIAFELRELDKLRLLKQGLMEDLLTGRVRVTDLLTEAAV